MRLLPLAGQLVEGAEPGQQVVLVAAGRSRRPRWQSRATGLYAVVAICRTSARLCSASCSSGPIRASIFGRAALLALISSLTLL